MPTPQRGEVSQRTFALIGCATVAVAIPVSLVLTVIMLGLLVNLFRMVTGL